ncbi:hypothetical protein Acsp02_40220 [Actinoplanes sp. NBRC 103695]|nr:hypothetical protein Acsp02_40220 [Actinoplanes sp. NBRC 103695]
MILISVSVLGLAACGEKSDPPTAASTPSTKAPVSIPPSPPASAGDSQGGGTSDKERCAAIKTSGDKFKADLLAKIQSGDAQNPETYRTILSDFAGSMNNLAAGDSKVAKATTTMIAELEKAAAAPDPVKAADGDALTKAAGDVESSCKAAGYTLKFG